ncbi:MAG: SCP2 sterol-binding domain-containing protein [Candidatus Bathyarchaeota archaeon]|nr:SCP2 sterol-binding domain-containing protein [Candidatus Bathyarchaeota archaeon]
METQAQTPKEFFEKILPARFKPEKAEGVNVVAQINVSGVEGGDWAVTIKDKKIQVAQSIAPSPDLSLKMTPADFMDLVNGKISAEKAFFTGKVQFKGNITVALKLRDAGFL